MPGPRPRGHGPGGPRPHGGPGPGPRSRRPRPHGPRRRFFRGRVGCMIPVAIFFVALGGFSALIALLTRI